MKRFVIIAAGSRLLARPGPCAPLGSPAFDPSLPVTVDRHCCEGRVDEPACRHLCDQPPMPTARP